MLAQHLLCSSCCQQLPLVLLVLVLLVLLLLVLLAALLLMAAGVVPGLQLLPCFDCHQSHPQHGSPALHEPLMQQVLPALALAQPHPLHRLQHPCCHQQQRPCCCCCFVRVPLGQTLWHCPA
jgi:hypothetical protein